MSFNEENAIENIVCKVVAMLSQPQLVNKKVHKQG